MPSFDEEAKVRVELDTREAKASLRGLTRDAAGAAKRVGDRLRRTIGRGLGVIGLGGGIGMGLAAVRGATQSGLGDVIGEAFGGFAANLRHKTLGNLYEEAIAGKKAREETIQAFGTIAGATGKIPPGAVNFFNQVKSLRIQEEKGRTAFEMDERFRTVGAKDLIDRLLEGIGTLLGEAVDALVNKLNPFK